MIPLKLTLKNFLCYRDNVPTLDFSGIHVACLCGPNGNGKSALLDAITWTLWGATARGRASDDLIYFGESEMFVELEFMARNTLYRTSRRYSKSATKGRGRGGANLQLQVSRNNEFVPITGNTLRETQASIIELIGMDYDTFVNSAFLIQGRSDEFTNKTPGDRKEVLGRILGLSQYDDLLEVSRAKAQENREYLNRVEGNLQLLESQIDAIGNPDMELDEVAQELKSISHQLTLKRREKEEAQLILKSLEEKSQRVLALQIQIPKLDSEIQNLKNNLRQREDRISAYDKLINDAHNIENSFLEYQKSRDQYEDMNSARANFDGLTLQGKALEQTIAQVEARLEEQLAGLQRRLTNELRPRIKSASQSSTRLEETKLSAVVTEEDLKEIASQRKILQNLASEEGQLTALLDPLKIEGEELKAKIELLSASHSEARCPLCDTTLGNDDCLRLSETYKIMIDDRREKYRSTLTKLEETRRLKAELELTLPVSERNLQEKQQSYQRLITTLEKDSQDMQIASAEATEATNQLNATEELLRTYSFARDDRQALQTINAQIAELSYSPDKHSGLYERMQQLQKFSGLHDRLKEAFEVAPNEREEIIKTTELVVSKEVELQDINTTLPALQNDISELPKALNTVQECKLHEDNLDKQAQSFLGRRGEIEARMQRLEHLRHQHSQMSKKTIDLRDELGIYTDLVQAFGKQGVQALLIETILPRIEDEANQLLARMTDGRMTVKLETQRELRSRRGEFAETLEIKISDELGPRNYEMFSGGEAFRINLALRIALSKVLAYRSGAPLPTLFIDEGFGTQDTAGRERIVDVIRAIEPDFQRIIVISHLEDLKDAFPVRIEVEKRAGESTCWIS